MTRPQLGCVFFLLFLLTRGEGPPDCKPHLNVTLAATERGNVAAVRRETTTTTVDNGTPYSECFVSPVCR